MTDAQVARLLRDIAEALRAGLPLRNYIDSPTTAMTMPARERELLAETLHGGGTFTTGFRRLDLLSDVELILVRAGERSGNLPASLDLVADGIERRRKARLDVLKGLAYPLLLMGAAGLILPLPIIVTAGVGAYLAKAIWMPLLVLSGLGFAVFVVPRLRPKSPLRTVPRRLMYRLPVVGAALRRGGHGRFAETLGRCISAGLGMHESLASAIAAADVPDIAAQGEHILARLQNGGTLTEAVQEARAFHPRFLARVAQAEATGRLPETLAELAEAEAAVAARMVRGLVLASVVVVFLSVVAVIGYGIISGFQDYLGGLDAQIKMNR